MDVEPLRFVATPRSGEVSALLATPGDPRALLALAHGAGAGMRHAFMEALAAALADRGIATLRYQFPYLERGRRRPDHRPVLLATVRSAVAEAERRAKELGGVALLAGGKSMGGRMTSMAAAEAPLPGVRGIVFVGFPLHAAGKPGRERADHLADVDVPMLFLQGTRDKLTELELLRPVCAELAQRPGAAAPSLHVVEGADHSFHVLKRSGRSDDEVLAELADQIRAFADATAPANP